MDQLTIADLMAMYQQPQGSGILAMPASKPITAPKFSAGMSDMNLQGLMKGMTGGGGAKINGMTDGGSMEGLSGNLMLA